MWRLKALYNLGLSNKKLGLYVEALEGFFKLQSIVRYYSEVVYHIAKIFELMGDTDQVGKHETVRTMISICWPMSGSDFYIYYSEHIPFRDLRY